MHLLVAFSLFVACVAVPQGYTAPSSSAPVPSQGGGFSAAGSGFGGGFSTAGSGFESGFSASASGFRGGFSASGSGFGSGLGEEISGGAFGVGGYRDDSGVKCGPGQVRHVDGSCVEPIVDKSYFVYNAPDLPVINLPPPELPPPKVEYNVVFVRTPEGPEKPEPIVVPPPQEKTLVYVLSKNGEVSQRVIEVPKGPEQTPEVYYVNYDEGDNPTLPGGFELQNVLASAVSQQEKVIEGRFGSGLGGGVGVSLGGVGGVGSIGSIGSSVGQPSHTYKSP